MTHKTPGYRISTLLTQPTYEPEFTTAALLGFPSTPFLTVAPHVPLTRFLVPHRLFINPLLPRTNSKKSTLVAGHFSMKYHDLLHVWIYFKDVENHNNSVSNLSFPLNLLFKRPNKSPNSLSLYPFTYSSNNSSNRNKTIITTLNEILIHGG